MYHPAPYAVILFLCRSDHLKKIELQIVRLRDIPQYGMIRSLLPGFDLLEFHARIRRGFADIAEAEPSRVVTVDASGTPDAVWEEIWKSLRRFR